MRWFDRIVLAVEVAALAATVLFVAMLFTNDPDAAPVAAGADGAAIFSSTCTGCHGAQGQGGYGPQLGGGAVVESLPDVADQIDVVTNGRGLMPDFGDALTPEQVQAVVDYTRSDQLTG